MERLIENSKVLVTGGAGFIGSNLCEALLEQGNKVTCLDNFATGKRENIDPFLSNSNFTLIEGDIRNLEDCNKALIGVDHVLHQAALGSVPRSVNDPITTNSVNVTGFLNMLFAAKEAVIKRFVYATSSSVFGDAPELPKLEDNIGKPLSPYAASKYINELYSQVFSDLYGIETIGLRYFNVFGKRQDPDGAYAAAIPKFINSFINHQSPTIHGDGSQSRDFTYIENVVQINQLAALTTDPNAVNTVYNVAFGERYDLNSLMKAIKKLLSAFDAEIGNVEVIYGEERKGDVKHSHASIDKAKSLLDYKPTHNLNHGLREAISWYWDNLRD